MFQTALPTISGLNIFFFDQSVDLNMPGVGPMRPFQTVAIWKSDLMKDITGMLMYDQYDLVITHALPLPRLKLFYGRLEPKEALNYWNPDVLFDHELKDAHLDVVFNMINEHQRRMRIGVHRR